MSEGGEINIEITSFFPVKNKMVYTIETKVRVSSVFPCILLAPSLGVVSPHSDQPEDLQVAAVQGGAHIRWFVSCCDVMLVQFAADFEWLHARLAENPDNAGVIIPSVPNKACVTYVHVSYCAAPRLCSCVSLQSSMTWRR